MAASQLRVYLTRGDTQYILPEIYYVFNKRPFTVKEAKIKLDHYSVGSILQLHKHLGILKKVPYPDNIKTVRKQRETQWQLTDFAYDEIKTFITEYKNGKQKTK